MLTTPGQRHDRQDTAPAEPAHRGDDAPMTTSDTLTHREMQVAKLVAVECLTSKAAAIWLGIGFRTVETYRTRIMFKLGVTGIAALARYMAMEGK